VARSDLAGGQVAYLQLDAAAAGQVEIGDMGDPQ
jgi:hypothetical protein